MLGVYDVDRQAHSQAHIVVVDDEPSVARFLSRALESAGYRTPRVFTNPHEAASYFDSVPRTRFSWTPEGVSL